MAVLVVFLVCWLPMKIFIIVIAYNPQIVETTTEFQFYAYYITYFTCHLLAMANSFANPILYSFMSLSFRVRFSVKVILKKLKYFFLYLRRTSSTSSSASAPNCRSVPSRRAV